MEMFAKIEIQGIVGMVERHRMPKDKVLDLFSVLVETVYTNSAGDVIIDSQWFSCRGIDLDIKKGDKVHLAGKACMVRYIPGEDRRMLQVHVEKIDKL